MKDVEFLAGLREGSFRAWNQVWLREELCNPERLDPLRRMVKVSDEDWILQLLSSREPQHLLIAHALVRTLIHSCPASVLPALRSAYDEARTQGDRLLEICFLHDLCEHPDTLGEYRERFVAVVADHPDAVKVVLFKFVNDDEGLLAYFSHRLRDVFSDDPQTLNAASKAFMYAAYLGLIEDADLRARAREVLEDHADKGDAFFRGVAQRVLSSFA